MVRLIFFLIFLVPLFSTGVNAQDNNEDCPILVESALNAADAACTGIGRNEACYGNIVIDAQTRDANVSFDDRGDVAGIVNISSMSLGAMNVARDEWGVALMRVQANLPDSLPGSNVTFVLFSDVVIEDAGYDPDNPPDTVSNATALESANIRNGPATDFEVIDSIVEGAEIVVNGRNETGDWLRIELPGSPRLGWIFAPLVTLESDVSLLNVAQPGDETQDTEFGPMQAFYFRSGIGDAPCTEAPDSGMLIQTPEGRTRVDLNINGVDVQLGSTAYLTAGEGANGNIDFNIHMVEGEARVEAEGVAQFVRAGQMLSVPMTPDYNPAGQPTPPMPYDGRQASLPLRLLERDETVIEIPPPVEPNPEAPVIVGVDARQVNATTSREDIRFVDANGDVERLNVALVSTSEGGVTFQFEGPTIDIPSDQQQAGAIIARETVCTEGTEGIEALFRISVTDSTGLESNVVEYRTVCGE